jgi:acetyl-CoA carboxylase carboxyl transferase subunit alpha
MWRDATKRELAAAALKITAKDLDEMKMIDAIVPEPQGGAHVDHAEAAHLLDLSLQKALAEVQALNVQQMLDARYEKFRKMAQFYKEN